MLDKKVGRLFDPGTPTPQTPLCEIIGAGEDFLRELDVAASPETFTISVAS